VLLGLAPARSAWFRDVGQWAHAGVVPVEFVKCLSAEEVRARLAGGRPFSALLVDGGLPSLDRDLIAAAKSSDCAVIVVGAGARTGRDWAAVGADAVLPGGFDRKDLIDALGAHATMIGRAEHAAPDVGPAADGGWLAPVVAVTGPGGTGASTVAIAVAQGLAADIRSARSVLLADLCLHAEQAMLHDARDVVPGIQEVVDAFRAGRPSGDELHGSTFAVEARGYSLLLGLRRARAWSTIRPRAFEAAIDALRQCYRVVVADIDADLEGEAEGGSIDVEERHVMARAIATRAHTVFVVGQPGMKGLHALARAITELLDFGVPSSRVVPVVNRAPRSGRARAESARALAQLVPAWAGVVGPVHLPERKVDESLRDGVRLGDALTAPLVAAYRDVERRASAEDRRPVAPEQVTPGSLGTWQAELAT
jgi:hypothetical protein